MLAKVMNNNKFTLVVSLPKNDLHLVEEALNAGADAVKVHLNVHHFASGVQYGSFSKEKEFLNEAIKLVKQKDKLLGVVPGDGGEFASHEELKTMGEMGVDFMSTYIEYAPVHMLKEDLYDLCGAIGPNDFKFTKELCGLGADIVEASIINQDDYRKDLSILDLSKYSHIVCSSDKPVLIPTQKNIKASEVGKLIDVGCKGIMIGAVAFDMNKEMNFSEVISSYRKAIDEYKL